MDADLRSRTAPGWKASFWSLCPAEPFRIFFPLATLLGISGVSLWPLYFTGLHKFYPGIMHARLMTEGFLAGFILGFLGTALPRLLAAPALRRVELGTQLALFLLTAGLHIGHQSRLGDLAFIGLMLVFGRSMLPRLRGRTELPPPGFVLVGLGGLSGLIGPVLWLCGVQGWTTGTVMQFGSLLLNQAFPLLPVLGVGTFLLPRILEIREEERRTQTPAWAVIAGVVLLSSYAWEAHDPLSPLPAWLRTLTVAIYLGLLIPFRHQARPVTTIALAAQAALVLLVTGLLFPLLWPQQRLAGLHVVFLGGFSLLIFSIATRVVLGHSGNSRLFAGRLPALQIASALIVVAAALRALGDFLPTRPHWLDGAAYLWMTAAAVWGWAVLPKVKVADPEGVDG